MSSEDDRIEGTISSFDETLFIITRRRWQHILDRHPELHDMLQVVLSAASAPDEVFTDPRGILHLVKKLEGMASDFLAVIARQSNSKAYLVTAFYMNTKRKERGHWKFKKLTLS